MLGMAAFTVALASCRVANSVKPKIAEILWSKDREAFSRQSKTYK